MREIAELRVSERSQTPTARKMSWDLIRVVAVLAVIVGHITYRGVLSHPELGGYPFTFSAQFGAATLLAVSGYFVCATLRKGDPARWLRSRVARVLPAYLVAVLVTYVIARAATLAFNGWRAGPGLFAALFGAPVPGDPTVAAGWPVPDGADLLGNLTLSFAWNFDVEMLDGSYWTLPLQLAAFTAAALLWPTKWRSRARLTALLWALLIVPFAAGALALLPEQLSSTLAAGYQASGLWRAYMFAIGVAIWLWSRDRLSHPVMVAMAALAVIAHATSTDQPISSALGYAGMLALICAAARGPDWDLAALALLRLPIEWLAGISFGVHLVHQQLGYILARVLVDVGVGPVWRMAAVLVAAIAAGWALTVLVERPAHLLLTARARSTSRPATGYGVPLSRAAERVNPV